MSAPRLEIHLDRIRHNARTLVERLGPLGITVCGVTKATLGSPEVARELLAAGVPSLGESRIENIERLRAAGITAPITLIRSPMVSQIDRVVASADASLNSEIAVIERLADSAVRQGRTHGIVLMVELGDRREGVMPADVAVAAHRVFALTGVTLLGIGTNLACQNGVIPDHSNMAELSALATTIGHELGIDLEIVSGGNSANLGWALGEDTDTGPVNHLRLGEAILLGLDPVRRTTVDGLRTDAISLVGEIIESKVKPSQPEGERGETAFGIPPDQPAIGGDRTRVIVAIGRQDTDPQGLGSPIGYEILGASSDHLVLDAPTDSPGVGSELRFHPNYSALLRSMTSPFITRRYLDSPAMTHGNAAPRSPIGATAPMGLASVRDDPVQPAH